VPAYLVKSSPHHAGPSVVDLNDIDTALSERIPTTEGPVVSPELTGKREKVREFFRGDSPYCRESRLEAGVSRFDLNDRDDVFVARNQVCLKTFRRPVA
jgi:hypothetical protein